MLKMEKGKLLGEPLKQFVEDSIKDYSIKKGEVFIVLSREGITFYDADFFMKYPKGVIAQGHGTATVRAEALYRNLVRTARKPSWIKHYKTNFMQVPSTLGDSPTTIEVNGTLTLSSNNFKATIPTRTHTI